MLRVSPQTSADNMEPHHETGFPTILSSWLREIVLSLPEAARTTIVELIIGTLLAGGGHVTQAFLALTPRLGWQAYHWMLERGRFRLLGLITALCGIIRREVRGRCFAIIDDTLAPRCSAKAPGAARRFDHASKANRPKFLLCQSFVTLSAVVPCRDRPRAVPVVTGLCRSVGNAGKLAIAKGLLRAVGNHLGPLYLLLDAWYMRGPLIRAALRLGHDVIGQATPPCSGCPHRVCRERAAAGGCMVRGSMLTRSQGCRSQPVASRGTAAGWPGCGTSSAVPGSCEALSSGRSGVTWRRAAAGPGGVCCCQPIPRCPLQPSLRHIPTGGARNPCSAILRWSMAWGLCGSAAASPCCAGSTSSRSPAPCWSC